MKTIIAIAILFLGVQLAQGATALLQREVILVSPTGQLSTNTVLEISPAIETGIEATKKAAEYLPEPWKSLVTQIAVAVTALLGVWVKTLSAKNSVLKCSQTAMARGIEVAGSDAVKAEVKAQSEAISPKVAAAVHQTVVEVKKETDTQTLTKADVKP